MRNTIFLLDQNTSGIDELKENLKKRILNQRNPQDPDVAVKYLTDLMNPEKYNFRMLWHRKDKTAQGIITYDAHRILLLYLASTLDDRKLGSYLLAKEAIRDMREQGAEFVITTYTRWENLTDTEAHMEALNLMEFYREPQLDAYLEVKSKNLPLDKYPKAELPGFSFPDFDPGKHYDMLLETALNLPDPFQQSLFPGDETKTREMRKTYLISTIFQKEGNEWRNVTPESSSVVLDSSGKCVGYLLCDAGRSRIVDIQILPEHRRKGIGREMLRKTVDRFKEKDIGLLYLSFQIRQKSCRQWARKVGFRDITQYHVWGWSTCLNRKTCPPQQEPHEEGKQKGKKTEVQENGKHPHEKPALSKDEMLEQQKL